MESKEPITAEDEIFPTIEEFLETWAKDKGYHSWLNCCCGSSLVATERFKIAGKEYAVLFAKHHVREALKEASTTAECDIDRDSIENAYPESKIV